MLESAMLLKELLGTFSAQDNRTMNDYLHLFPMRLLRHRMSYSSSTKNHKNYVEQYLFVIVL